jgi:hypothetical protein
MMRDPRFADGMALVLLALLCVRMNVLTIADVAQLVAAVLALLSNRLAKGWGDSQDSASPPRPPCTLTGCPHVSPPPNPPTPSDRPS